MPAQSKVAYLIDVPRDRRRPVTAGKRPRAQLLPSLLWILCFAGSGSLALGQVPTTLHYQGRLLQNTTDQDAVTGTVDIDFSIWTDAAGGTKLWSESWTGVTLSNGIFSVLLGSNGSPLAPTDFAGDSTLFLELEIDGETMSPRQQLGSVLFAMVDEPANEIQDLELAGNTLSLSGDGTAIDLSGYLDNTDAQTLDLTGDTLTISGSGSSVELSASASVADLQGLADLIDLRRLVFVSSQTFKGNFGGLNGADASCQSLADAAGLRGSFKAWLSNGGSSPSTRFVQFGSFELVDGTPVADDWADLTDGSLQNGISLDENGVSRSGRVWTNTDAFGTVEDSDSDYHCNNWNSTSKDGFSGTAGATNSNWTVVDQFSCAIASRLYCFQQTVGDLDDQQLSLSGNQLQLTSADGTDVVDLSAYLDNTDAQDLSLSGSTLSLTGDASAVDLSGFANTDAQTLSLAGDTLTISGSGSSVDLGSSATFAALAAQIENLRRRVWLDVRTVFVTSGTYSSDLGGLDGADALCQTLADSAWLIGTYRAWLSTDADTALVRLAPSRDRPIQLVDGSTVADDWADFIDGSLKIPINQDELGTSRSGLVWTGSDADGTSAAGKDCKDWTSAGYVWTGEYGDSQLSNSGWSSEGSYFCSDQKRLYCLSD